jgi:hypothetical protein
MMLMGAWPVGSWQVNFPDYIEDKYFVIIHIKPMDFGIVLVRGEFVSKRSHAVRNFS